MATFVLEDLAAAIEVMVFPKTMLQYGELLDADAIVVVKGRVDGREDTTKLMAMEIARPELHLDGSPPLTLRVRAGVLDDDRVAKLRELLRTHPGHSQVFVRVRAR
jgi:DNA polymerase-3 subunit alpha